MQQIMIRVRDKQKADLLREVLAALDFVEHVNTIEVTEPDSNGGDQTVPSALAIHPQQAQMRQEVAAFDARHEELREQYLGQFVAMRQGKVIDHDRDEETLINRVRERFPEDVVLFRQVQETLPPPLVFRSPRYGDS